MPLTGRRPGGHPAEEPARTRIKVSGVTVPEDAALAAELGADLVACVFYASSPRYVTIEQAWSIRRAMPAHVRLVGIFVDAPIPIVRRVVDHCRCDLVQLFGAETSEDVDALAPVAFKAVSVSDEPAIQGAERAFLGRRAGGQDAPAMLLQLSDRVSEAWAAAAAPARRGPLLLASTALGPGTVGRALETVAPWGVDVWDAVESSPGQLDPARLEAFVAAVRAADAGRAARE